MTKWDYTKDVVVVGTGGGGMTAALTAAKAGLDTLVIEKNPHYGGSTALSGGGIWIPNNFLLKQDGVEDSFEKAQLYLQETVGDRTPQALQDAYLKEAPEMIEYLVKNSHLELQRPVGYADYYPELPGGMSAGRALESKPFNGKKLGKDLDKLIPMAMEIPGGLAFTIKDFSKLGMIIPTWAGKWTALKVGLRTVFAALRGARLLSMGQALIASLRLSLKEEGVPLWLSSPMKDLIVEDGVVVGVVVEKEGKLVNVRANKGVILAAGGFAHNQEMREEYQKGPINHEWSSANQANTGDTIQAGMKIGAKTDLMEDAWWGPSSMPPELPVMFHVGERSYPGGIMVNSEGERFTNEAASYVEVVHVMYKLDTEEVHTVPATFIMDQRYKDTYIFGTLFPGQKIPQEFFDKGYIVKADTIEELAEKCNLPADKLTKTIERFNKFAKTGIDEDFRRGDSAYDRYYGDPTVSPNPCLAPIAKAPFYALEMVPGDLGTKGGLVIDEHARVLSEDGNIIKGLFAVGNNSASVMGNTYPGPGSTIGPSMTFGYIAAKYLANN